MLLSDRKQFSKYKDFLVPEILTRNMKIRMGLCTPFFPS